MLNLFTEPLHVEQLKWWIVLANSNKKLDPELSELQRQELHIAELESLKFFADFYKFVGCLVIKKCCHPLWTIQYKSL